MCRFSPSKATPQLCPSSQRRSKPTLSSARICSSATVPMQRRPYHPPGSQAFAGSHPGGPHCSLPLQPSTLPQLSLHSLHHCSSLLPSVLCPRADHTPDLYCNVPTASRNEGPETESIPRGHSGPSLSCVCPALLPAASQPIYNTHCITASGLTQATLISKACSHPPGISTFLKNLQHARNHTDCSSPHPNQ